MSSALAFHHVLAEELDAIDGNDPAHSGPAANEDEVFRKIHERREPLSALCLSGGGIRSATFSLGVMQTLAKHRLLHRFNYLSTVSGGGYIGSWLTAWIHRKAEQNPHTAVSLVCDELAGGKLSRDANANLPDATKGVVLGEAPAVTHLRQFSQYLAPHSGLFAADFWTLIATVLRNVLLNWIVLIPVVLAALGVPRLFASAANISYDYAAARTLGIVSMLVFAWVVAWVSRQRRVIVQRRPSQNVVLLLGVAPVLLGAILFTLAWAWRTQSESPAAWEGDAWWAGLVPFGVGLMAIGWLAYRIDLVIRPANLDPDPTRRPSIVDSFFEFLSYVLSGAVGAWILRLGLHVFDGTPPASDDWWLAQYTVAGPPIFLLSFTTSAAFFVGLASGTMSEEDREWWSRFGAWLLMASIAWIAVSGVTLLLPQLLAEAYTLAVTAIATLGSGAITVLGGLSSKTIGRAKSDDKDDAKRKGTRREQSRWLSIAVKIALPVFVVLFAVALSLATDFFVGLLTIRGFTAAQFLSGILSPTDPLHLWLVRDRVNVVVLATAFVLGAAAAWFVGINTFSLHAMYRNRLIRAYLGASRGTHRRADLDRFIGFNRKDDMQLCDTRPKHRAPRPLFHVINMALNLVGGEELAWQERKAESMTATSLHVGSYQLNYRRTSEYGGRPKTLTLGTAMAISGAAASPNMGYHSSPVLTFILTLFNARLGWWLGNPGKYGERTYYRDSPRWALRPLFAEALGQTDARHPYVYASDGGHFENLGLYEMVRRRCGFILVVDAGADPACGFEDLSSAIRKIRSDFGISIELDFPRHIYARDGAPADTAAGRFAITGRIKYGDVDVDRHGEPVAPGRLVYLKPAFYDRDEPIDVNNYANLSRTFPHETTADQFFTESQFESYRALGCYETERVCVELPESAPTLDDLWRSVRTHLNLSPDAHMLT
jgi:Patatin-like phospholipase